MSALLPVVLCITTGCASMGQGFTPPWKKSEAKKETPKDIMLAGGLLQREPIDPRFRQELDAIKQLIEDKKFAEAEGRYHKLTTGAVDPNVWNNLNPFDSGDREVAGVKITEVDANGKKKNKFPRAVYEEALFGEAEAQRLQKNYRAATDTYTKLLVEFPRTQFTPNACQGLFEIADYWLEPTRRQMDEYQEQLQGKRWMVTPAMYVHFNKEMPFLDTEGHAVLVLNTIRLHDIKGPMGEKALLYLGTINFFRQDYKEADFYFTQLYSEYPNSNHASKAIKQSVICKQLQTGGSKYDCRGVEESKKLLMTAQAAYPDLARDEKWIETQLKSINIQQADRDFRVAEFYQRTGHPGSAYFYYELVCRRYPGTSYATKAAERKTELRSKAEKDTSPEEANPPPERPSPARPSPAVNSLQPPLAPPVAPRTLPNLEPAR